MEDTTARERRIGENTDIRQGAGLELDEEVNARGRADRDISAAGSRVRAVVLHAREDLAILEEVLGLRPRLDRAPDASPTFAPGA